MGICSVTQASKTLKLLYEMIYLFCKMSQQTHYQNNPEIDSWDETLVL
jgi:hypothetical protein